MASTQPSSFASSKQFGRYDFTERKIIIEIMIIIANLQLNNVLISYVRFL